VAGKHCPFHLPPPRHVLVVPDRSSLIDALLKEVGSDGNTHLLGYRAGAQSRTLDERP
jgi:hypothetical protein